ncbi:tetratricopeptide repeat protein [Methanospirillum stamsii]|uniref:Uncharacterized protein n=1 Tax=Methanospirillum stamsii TaxID=1277351 RepID=A0A2V2N788_9EURY|nr:tetratricopeptide repeat protein [Methanospirillum stamsii]PWR75709.1 hypothetical protein DLD82_03770 [Methanospirillum stamsii]
MKNISFLSLLFIVSLVCIAGNAICGVFGDDNDKPVDTLLKKDPQNATMLVTLGIDLSNSGRYNESVDAYNQALILEPGNSSLWNLKGSVLQKLEKYEEAIRAYNQALSIDHENIDAWNNKGSVLVEIDKLEDASKAFNQALLIDPENVFAKENLEQVLDKINELTFLKSVEILKTKMEIRDS